MTSVFTFAAPDASAHGNVDQSHTFAFTGKVTPIGVNLVGQEFTPTANNIVSVDVQLRSNAQIGQQGFVTATLYQTSVIPGNIIGVAPAVQLTIASTQIVHLDFPSAITLTPGNSYWIVVQSGNPFLWVVQSPGTYTGGTGFVNAITPVIDFWFITYSSPADTIPPVITAALVPICGEDDEGLFTVQFSATDENLASVTAQLNGITVSDGQIVELELDDDEEESEFEDGILEIEASSFSLVVTANDSEGNSATESVVPSFSDFVEECEEEEEEEEDHHHHHHHHHD